MSIKATWSVDMEALTSKIGDRLDKTVRRATTEVFKDIVKESPIDTGRFISNWNVSKDSPDESFNSGGHNYRYESFDVSRGYSEAQKAMSYQAGGQVYMTNTADYGVDLEYGYSHKTNEQKASEGWPRKHPQARPAPAGMVRLTIQNWDDYVSKAAKVELSS